jgi:hypothetical protein
MKYKLNSQNLFTILFFIVISFSNCGKPNLAEDYLKYSRDTAEAEKLLSEIIEIMETMSKYGTNEPISELKILTDSKEILTKSEKAVLILKGVEVKNPELIILHDSNTKRIEAIRDAYKDLITGAETKNKELAEGFPNKLEIFRTYQQDYNDAFQKLNKKVSGN